MRTTVFTCCGLVALACLSGCVSDRQELRNDRGQVVNCENQGWGWLGAPMAMANQSKCLKQAEAAGFHPAGIAETATPPKATVETAPITPPSAPGAATQATSQAATPKPATAAVSNTPPTDIAARLKELDDLYKSGLITKEEYDKKRQAILSSL